MCRLQEQGQTDSCIINVAVCSIQGLSEIKVHDLGFHSPVDKSAHYTQFSSVNATLMYVMGPYSESY